jgi:phospholipid-binding lipoprotein MlaA
MADSSKRVLMLGTALLLLGLTACSARQSSEREDDPDPLEPINRVVYRVNDIGDRYLARPAARLYRKGTPLALRHGIGNFFDNLRYPITIVNDFLQGKFRQGGADLSRFVINSTVGLFGLFDPAAEIGLEEHDEDFGQTLWTWGVPQGPYLVVPVLGPYMLSEAFGDLLDTQVSLLTQYPDSSVSTKAGIWYLLHRRYELLGVDKEVRRAFDPYTFVRDAYMQRRLYKLYDGEVPEEELYPEDEFDEADEE